MIIDAHNIVLGRLGSFVAKKALLGETLHVVNSEQAVMTGNKKDILAKYAKNLEIGTPFKGPFQPKAPHLFVRKSIRGMLPYKQPKGREAFKRILCYKGVPEVFKDKQTEKLEGISVLKLTNAKFLTVAQVCDFLGGK